jgi:type IV pilus assembly protein PilA
MQHTHAVHRVEEPEAGFTLVELMVVVLIIAILITVLIPTFVGARTRAQDRAAQASLRNALTAAKVVYTESTDYTKATPAELTLNEPSLKFVAAAVTPPGSNAVSVDPVSVDSIVLAGISKSGACFFVSDDESVGGFGVRFATGSGGGCSAAVAPPPASASWKPAW